MRPELIDVSLPLGPETPVFPGDPAVEVETVARLDDSPYHLSRLAMGSHAGTHFDAPAHFIAGGRPAWEVPLERFLGPAWVIEVPEAPAIEVEALAARWPEGPVERVLLKTPHSGMWDTPRAAEVSQALSLEAARWLLDRGVGLVGIDALSIEAGEDDFPVHHALLGAEVLILEGLDLSRVTPGRYELVCLPLKLTAPDGAPVRAALRPL